MGGGPLRRNRGQGQSAGLARLGLGAEADDGLDEHGHGLGDGGSGGVHGCPCGKCDTVGILYSKFTGLSIDISMASCCTAT